MSDDDLDLGPGWKTTDGIFFEYRRKGFVELQRDKARGWMLGGIKVYPEHRGKGIGTEMLKAVTSIDANPVWLVIDPMDRSTKATSLKRWYRKHGFVEYPKPTRRSVGIRMKYTPDFY